MDDDMRSAATRLVIDTPRDLVSVIPYLLGFHPEASLVAVGCGGPNGSCALRFDLPLGGEAAAHLAALLSRHRFPDAMLAAYGPDALAGPALALARSALADAGVRLAGAVRVDGGRLWPQHCRDGVCCPAEGVPITTTAVQARAVVEGLVALPARESLAAGLAPVGGTLRQRMREETERALARPPIAEQAGLELVRGLARRTERGDPPPGPPEVAELTVALTAQRVRDEAWVRAEPGSASRHLLFWRHVVRRAEPRYVPAPACIFAYLALVSGDGGLANVALDRSDAVDPGYSMALLLRRAVASGIHPREVRIRLSPEDLAAAYADPERLPRAA